MKQNIRSLFEREYSRKKKYIENNDLEAFRLYDRAAPELPLAVDIYKKSAVVHLFGHTPAAALRDVEHSLQGMFGIKDVFYKNRTKVDLPMPETSQKAAEFGRKMQVKEYGNLFWCNLADYLDTGLFLDHRETRKWIQSESKKKVVLNTFAYTGSFSVYAAKGGASKTYSVDLSKTYTDWIKKNLELNHLPADNNWVYKMDTREFFKYAKKKSLTFDIIIIDPPSFSRNKGKSFSVQQDHPELINAALELLTPGGFILFSNNKQDFRLQKEKLSPCLVENIQRQTIPPDFTHPNIHYCFIIRPLH